MADESDPPPVRRLKRRAAPPPEEMFVARLGVAPVAAPLRPLPDAVAARRAKAEHLCLWMGCLRVPCRRTRHCMGREALCVFEQRDVKRPILE